MKRILILCCLLTIILLPYVVFGQVTDPRVADLVKAGKLRVGLGLGSAALALKDPATGEVRGPAVDLARALAARIGVEVQPVEYQSPDAVLNDAGTDVWDVSFLLVTPARTAIADFSPPYMRSDWTYLVLAGSSIRSVADADKPGFRITVTRPSEGTRSSFELKRAEKVFTDSLPDSLDLVRTGRAEAQAAPRTVLLAEAAKFPGFRVLEDSLSVVSYAAVAPKGNAGRLAYLSEFIEEAKASGLVKQTIERYGLQGVEIAPAATKGTQ
jgi:polar amino acid transport system substrate-binding protein